MPICTADFPLLERFHVFIHTHTGPWIEAYARQGSVHASTLWIESRERIVGGTSGGPVMTTDGRLLGVVSTGGGIVLADPADASETELGGMSSAPRVHQMAPGWLVRRMLDPRRELREMRRQIRKREQAAQNK